MRVIGLDPALGGGCAFTVAELGEKFVILDAITREGLTKTEQIFAHLETLVNEYHPSMVVIEFDAQQKGIGNDDRLQAMSQRHGFVIRPHYTRGQKMDEVFGVASMDQSFKAGDIRIPYGDQHAKDRMMPLITQFKQWRPDIATKKLTQDLVMSTWFCWRIWMQAKKAHKTPPAPASRPSWVMAEANLRTKIA